MPPRSRTNRAPRVEPNWHERNHIDLGKLDQRVTGLENAIGDIGDQLREIGRRLEARPTDVWKIIGGVVTIISLVGGFLLIGKQPYDEGLGRHDREISRLVETAVAKDDFKASIDLQQRRNLAMDASIKDVEKDVTDARLALATLAGTSSERHEEYLRDHAALATRIDSVDGALIKRPEIEALNKGLGDQIIAGSSSANERINSVILSLNELRHDVGANYTLGDGLKSALDRIDRMQQEINLLARTPGREAVPVPVGPPR